MFGLFRGFRRRAGGQSAAGGVDVARLRRRWRRFEVAFISGRCFKRAVGALWRPSGAGRPQEAVRIERVMPG